MRGVREKVGGGARRGRVGFGWRTRYGWLAKLLGVCLLARSGSLAGLPYAAEKWHVYLYAVAMGIDQYGALPAQKVSRFEVASLWIGLAIFVSVMVGGGVCALYSLHILR